MNATLLSLTGAQLRAEPTNAAFVAELARRAAKRVAAGKPTVAATFTRMHEATAAKKAAKVAPKRVVKTLAAVVAPAPAPAVFTRTTEVITTKKPTLTTRMDAVEGSLLSIASALASQDALLRALIAKLA